MEHEQIKWLLSEYVEGILPAEQAQEVETHLSGCASCKADLELLRRALQLVHKMPRVTAPPDFSKRVRRRAIKSGLIHKKRRTRLIRQMMAPFEGSIIVLLATMGALVVFLLLVQSELEPIVLEKPPSILLVETTQQINEISEMAWDQGGTVLLFGRTVPPHSRLGAPVELELWFPPEGFQGFLLALESITPKLDLPKPPPTKEKDGFYHLVIQFRRHRSLPPTPKDPASSSTPLQTQPDPGPPPPDDKE